MTKLNGSEKQIAWAESIREEMINGVTAGGQVMVMGVDAQIEKAQETKKHYAEKCERKGRDKNTNLGYLEAVKNEKLFTELKNEIESCVDSTWFIDNRNIQNFFTKKVFSIEA